MRLVELFELQVERALASTRTGRRRRGVCFAFEPSMIQCVARLVVSSTSCVKVIPVVVCTLMYAAASQRRAP
jgi:hypothetical protein